MLKNLAFLTLIGFACAKLDFGPCPAPITQAPYDASMEGTYYLQGYDNQFDYLVPLMNVIYKMNGLDCLTLVNKPTPEKYNVDALPLQKRLLKPYTVYQDPTQNALVGYMCIDSRTLNDLISLGL